MRKGFTIVEISLVIVLMGILLSILFPFLLRGLRIWNDSQKDVGLMNESLIIARRFVKELEHSRTDSVGFHIDGEKRGISFLSAQLPGESGTLQYLYDTNSIEWQKYVIYYREGSLLKRREIVCCSLPGVSPDSISLSYTDSQILSGGNDVMKNIYSLNITEASAVFTIYMIHGEGESQSTFMTKVTTKNDADY